jgi:hypothetical protein
MIPALLLLLIIVVAVLIVQKLTTSPETSEMIENIQHHLKGSSKNEIALVLANIQRWKKEGKITREEYDHLTDICLQELRQILPKE